MKKLSFILFLFLPFSLWAQQVAAPKDATPRNAAQRGAAQRGAAQRFSVSGYITDAETGESLIGANILNIPGREGSAANTYGFYSLTLKPDSLQLRYSFVGYESKEVDFFLRKDTVLNIQLQPANRLQEVVVTAERPIEENTQMSRIDVPIDQIKKLPALMGEVDVLKVIQLLPGVQSGTEGSSGIYVRGGGPDQNLILLDGVPVYNASHLFGFFSVFNADAINKVELVKGGFPARYGGRLSSVIDISMKEGNMKELKGEGGVGIIASRLTLEGPIQKDKSSFIVSARRTYLDILARPIIKAQTDGDETVGYYFYDLNAKVNYKLSERDRLFVSAYLGDDRFYAHYKYDDQYNGRKSETKEKAGLNWGNITSAIRWNHIINQKLFSNTTLTYSRYRFNLYDQLHRKETFEEQVREERYQTEYRSAIQDFSLKTDLDYLPNPNHYVRAGASIIHHRFDPGVFAYDDFVEGDTLMGSDPTFAIEHAAYIEDDFKINDQLKLNAGLHFSGFAVDQEYYTSLQPRVSLRYLILPDLSAKASFASMTQFIHLLTNSGLGMPTDLWVPSTASVKPQQSQQVALGIAKTYATHYEVSLEGYYKKMHNLIEYKEGASFLNLDKNWENKITTGRGWSYGAEVFLQKKTGKTSGWIGYTLSWTNRQFEELNFGEVYPYKYDRRHDLSIAVNHSFSKKLELSGTWVYGTGNAITLPVAQYQYVWNGIYPIDPAGHNNYSFNNVDVNSRRNEYRMPAYHRLDLSLSLFKATRWGERRWVFGVYNAYNRQNPFFIHIGYDYEAQKRAFRQVSLFQLIPSVSYNFKF
jgi:outer membrane receptor for ferrienterochelin and colicin